MENNKILLDSTIPEYFNSIEEAFYNYFKTKRITTWVNLITVFPTIFFIGSILPIIPLINYSGEMLTTPIPIVCELLSITPPTVNFLWIWLAWGVISFVIFLPFKVFEIIANRCKPKLNIPVQELFFCYIYLSRKDIGNYLTNKNAQHIEKCEKYIKIIIKNLNQCGLSDKDDDIEYYETSHVINDLVNQFKWFKLESETRNIITALGSVKSKILSRVNQQKDISSLKVVFDYLLLHEFSKIKPKETSSEGVQIADLKSEYFSSFARELNLLSSLNSRRKNINSSSNSLSKVLNWLTNGLKSSSISVLFFSWFILFGIAFLLMSIFIINITGTPFDSTLIVGMTTAPFIGAVTFSAAIYSKSKG